MSEFFRQYKRMFLGEITPERFDQGNRLEQLFQQPKQRHNTVADLTNPSMLGFDWRNKLPVADSST